MKEWYVQIKGEKLGPFNKRDLKNLPGINFDTLVWKTGFKKWVPLRDVKELEDLFEEKPRKPEKIRFTHEKLRGKDEVIALQEAPPFFIFWLILLVLLITFIIYKYYLNL